MLFFELIQIAIGNREQLSHIPTEEEWQELYSLAKKQALVGITFMGVERLPNEQRPPKKILLQWYTATERIKAKNADMDQKALKVANRFLKDGFRSVILKGQGIAQLYPQGEYRTSGDIDVWVEGGHKRVLDYVRRYTSDSKPVYHHVDFPVVRGLDIEVHFTPSWMNSPFTNRRLQRFFRKSAKTLFVETTNHSSITISPYTELPVPSLAFNRIYILIHIYRHLFHEGIGLRQLLDYYFVLCKEFTEDECEETMETLRALKMERFTGAVMWVLQRVFLMEDKFLLTDPNEREGRFLLNEIMLAGNFGHHDERMQHKKDESDLSWGIRKVKRNFRFIRSYPSEVIWSPFFKIWHWFWRKRMNRNVK